MLFFVYDAGFFSLCYTHDIYSIIHATFDLLKKKFHILILLKEKLVPSLIPHSEKHVDFLLTKQVGAHPLYVYFSDLDKSARPFST